ncbi:MAG: hypothetical protein MJK12_14695 [Colwellia sp.]|nr:hypothetical protein [Colwellia sp.]
MTSAESDRKRQGMTANLQWHSYDERFTATFEIGVNARGDTLKSSKSGKHGCPMILVKGLNSPASSTF